MKKLMRTRGVPDSWGFSNRAAKWFQGGKQRDLMGQGDSAVAFVCESRKV
jgi:hypothetical protein